MKITSIYYSSHFKKSVKKYQNNRKVIEKKIKKFTKNPFDSQLKTHKLTGKLEKYWSFSIDYHTRILFEFIDKKTIAFIDIGSHDIYK